MGAVQQMLFAGGGLDPLWTPNDLDGPIGPWLNDDSSQTLASGVVSQWNDLSDLAAHFTQGTAANRPTPITGGLNGRRTTQFDGVNDLLINNGASARDLMRNARAGWAFAVYKKLATDGGTTRVFHCISNGTSATQFRFGALASQSGNADRPAMSVRRLDADSVASLAAATSNGANWQMYGQVMRWENRNGFLYIDGDLDASNSTLTAASGATSNTQSAGPVSIGANTGGTDPADIELAEIVYGSGSYPSQAEIDRIFGYFAHRWGLTSLLDVSHPYKTDPPRTKKDPNFSGVVTLTQAHGPNGSLMMPDKTRKVWTLAGNAVIDTTDPDFPDGALLCDGTGDYASTPSSSSFDIGSSATTIEIEGKPDVVNSQRTLLARRESAGSATGWMLYTGSSGELGFIGYSAADTVAINLLSAAGVVAVDTKALFRAVRNSSGGWELSYAGTVVASGTESAPIAGNGQPLYRGRQASNTGRDFDGHLGVARITSVARSSGNFTPPTSFPNS